MTVLAVLLLIACYGAAGYLWWAQRSPIYLMGLLSGHLSAIASPFWQVLYGIVYSRDLSGIQTLIGQPIPIDVLIAAGWYYPLPALLVLFLYRTHWWFPGPLTTGLTYIVMLFYHLLVLSLGVRNGIVVYRAAELPFDFPNLVLAGLMSALISFGLLYALLSSANFGWTSLLLLVLPAALTLSVIVNGVLGAPLWASLLFGAQEWAVGIGLLSTLALLAWGVLITARGMGALQSRAGY